MGKPKLRCGTKDYVKFISYCMEYVSRLRLGHWNITYKFDQAKESDRLGHCIYRLSNYSALIILFADWAPDDIVNDINLRDTALHEVLHLACAELTKAAINKAHEEVIFDREHELIKKLCLGLIHRKK